MNPVIKKSLALYGGSFDPVHCAHLIVARSALEQVGVDAVVFIPAAHSPLKSNTAVASAEDRLAMLRLATAGEPRFEVDCSELERGGTSYTIDTVADFRRRYPTAALHWIIGADQIELLPKWHRIGEIVCELTFIVLRRPGYSTAVPPIAGLRQIEIKAPLMAHSSSEVRKRLAGGGTVEGWLPPSVEAFISSRGLYTRQVP
jgi:nicotinate-nucleotide adenylyltransferase